MTILVIGFQGHLARALLKAASLREIAIVALGRPDCDLTRRATLERTFAKIAPSVVINAGAYTNVDGAEKEPEQAFAVNADGAGDAASLCSEVGARFIHVSTDYVFDGEKGEPYGETDTATPLNAYGRSKLEGEKRVLGCAPAALVLRTAWIFAPTGRNFATTMLDLAATREHLDVVTDQTSCPTFVDHFADALLTIATNSRCADLRGLFHLAGSGGASRFQFAKALFEESALLGGPSAEVRPTLSSNFPLPAQRPIDSRLDCREIEDIAGIVLPDWRGGVRACLQEVAKQRGWVAGP